MELVWIWQLTRQPQQSQRQKHQMLEWKVLTFCQNLDFATNLGIEMVLGRGTKLGYFAPGVSKSLKNHNILREYSGQRIKTTKSTLQNRPGEALGSPTGP